MPCGGASLQVTGSKSVTISKASPAISESPTSASSPDDKVTDTATLTGGSNPTGTIEFQAYDVLSCSGTPLEQETVSVNGDGTYGTPTGLTAGPVGTFYSRTATYSGDAANTGAVSICETVEVVPS